MNNNIKKGVITKELLNLQEEYINSMGGMPPANGYTIEDDESSDWSPTEQLENAEYTARAKEKYQFLLNRKK